MEGAGGEKAQQGEKRARGSIAEDEEEREVYLRRFLWGRVSMITRQASSELLLEYGGRGLGFSFRFSEVAYGCFGFLEGGGFFFGYRRVAK